MRSKLWLPCLITSVACYVLASNAVAWPPPCDYPPPEGYIIYKSGAELYNSECYGPPECRPYEIFNDSGLGCDDPNLAIQPGDQLILLSGIHRNVVYTIVAIGTDQYGEYALLDHDPGTGSSVSYLVYPAGTLTLQDGNDLRESGHWDPPCDPNDLEHPFETTCRLPSPQGPLERWFAFADAGMRASFGSLASGSATVAVAVAERALGGLQQAPSASAGAFAKAPLEPGVTEWRAAPRVRLSWATFVFRLIARLLAPLALGA